MAYFLVSVRYWQAGVHCTAVGWIKLLGNEADWTWIAQAPKSVVQASPSTPGAAYNRLGSQVDGSREATREDQHKAGSPGAVWNG